MPRPYWPSSAAPRDGWSCAVRRRASRCTTTTPTTPRRSAATLEALRRDDGRLLVLFQPHLFSRTRHLARDFARALADADVVAVTDIYPAREQPIAGVTRQARGRRARGAAPGDAGRRGCPPSTRAAPSSRAGRGGATVWSRSEPETSTALRRSCWRACGEDRGGSPTLTPDDARHRRNSVGHSPGPRRSTSSRPRCGMRVTTGSALP